MLLLIAASLAQAAPADTCTASVKECAEQAMRAGKVTEGIETLRAAAARGDTSAMRSIGIILMSGQGVYQDPEGAVGWFYEAALKGDRESMRLLGAAFRDGIGVKADRKLAAYWSQRARN